MVTPLIPFETFRKLCFMKKITILRVNADKQEVGCKAHQPWLPQATRILNVPLEWIKNIPVELISRR